MTNLEFRNYLLSVMAPVLGVYIDGDGNEYPAINLGADLVPGLRVEGLEVVILASPTLVPIREYGSDGVEAVERRRTVLLKMWDVGGSLEPAQRIITKHFPNTSTPRVVPATSETIAQAQYEITETEDI